MTTEVKIRIRAESGKASRDIEKLEAALNDAANSAGDFTDATKKARPAVKAAADASEKAAQSVKATDTAMRSAAKAVWDFTAGFRSKLRPELINTAAALQIWNNAIGAARTALSAMRGVVESFAGGARLNDIALQFGATAEQADRATQAAVVMAQKLGGSVDENFMRVAKTLGGYAGELGEIIPAMKDFSPEALRAGAGIEYLFNRFAAGVGQGEGLVAIIADINVKLTQNRFETGKTIAANEHMIALFSQLRAALFGVSQDSDRMQAAIDRATSSIVKGFAAAVEWGAQAASVIEIMLDRARALFNVIQAGGSALTGSLRLVVDAARFAVQVFVEGFEIAFDAVKDQALGMADALGAVASAIRDAFVWAAKEIMGPFGGALGWIAGQARQLADDVGSAFGWIADKSEAAGFDIRASFSSAFSGVGRNAQEAREAFLDSFTTSDALQRAQAAAAKFRAAVDAGLAGVTPATVGAPASTAPSGGKGGPDVGGGGIAALLANRQVAEYRDGLRAMVETAIAGGQEAATGALATVQGMIADTQRAIEVLKAQAIAMGKEGEALEPVLSKLFADVDFLTGLEDQLGQALTSTESWTASMSTVIGDLGGFVTGVWNAFGTGGDQAARTFGMVVSTIQAGLKTVDALRAASATAATAQNAAATAAGVGQAAALTAAYAPAAAVSNAATFGGGAIAAVGAILGLVGTVVGAIASIRAAVPADSGYNVPRELLQYMNRPGGETQVVSLRSTETVLNERQTEAVRGAMTGGGDVTVFVNVGGEMLRAYIVDTVQDALDARVIRMAT